MTWKQRVTVPVVAISAAFLTLPNVSADDWAEWRGPMRSGISLETDLVDSWNPETGENVLWESPIGGRAAPVVMNGRVYLGCRTDDDVTNPETRVHAREQVVCRDAATGDVLWQDIFHITKTDIPAPRVGWAALAGDPATGRVYMHSVSGLFRCYDADGNVMWEKSLLEEYGKISGYGGRTQTPIIDEDKVIVGYFGLSWGSRAVPPPKMSYYAFDKMSGDLLWIAPVGGPPKDTNYSNPIITVVDGQRLLVGGGADGGIHAINARSGKPVWSFNMSRRGLNTTPAVDGDYVYISHGEDNIDNTNFGRVECIDMRGEGDITATNSVWRVDGIKAGYTGLVVAEGMLFVVADTGMLHAFDKKTGEELWTYSLGTVGKGSPTFADGKLYVMEVNGNIHILKPTREGCESLSHVELIAADKNGMDEIYGTPAISDGRVFFVTRDRTFCIGNKNAGTRVEHDIPALVDEQGTEEVVDIRVIPAEPRISVGESVEFAVQGLNAQGRVVAENLEAEWKAPENAAGITISGNTVSVAADAPSQGLEFEVTAGEHKAMARLRSFTPLPWSWDFEGFRPKQVPTEWVSAFLKLQPLEVDGGTVMKKSPKGRPSSNHWLGYWGMTNYTVQADFLMTEEKRRLPSVGLVNQGYNFVMIGNTSKLELNAWAPHKRVEKVMRFRSDPDVWYTMKLCVKEDGEKATVYGKVWKRDEPEPEDWTITVEDPHPGQQGGPGLYFYCLADCLVDNVSVTETK